MSDFRRSAWLVCTLCLACGLWPALSGCTDKEPPATPPVVVSQEPAPKGAPSEPEEAWFVDEAPQRGIDLVNRTGEPEKKQFIMSAVGPSAAVLDADGDGLLDVYVVNGSWLVGGKRDQFYEKPDGPRNALYIQQPDGTFKDEAKERGVDDGAWGFGACAADLDNDGDQDLLVSNLGPNRLYINDGNGRFTDIAKEAGLVGPDARVEWSTGIACGDYDRDGRLDVYIGNYADMFLWMRSANSKIERDSQGNIVNAAVCEWQGLKVYCGPLSLPRQQDHLYRNAGGKNGALRFEDATKSSGVFRSEIENERRGPQFAFQILFTDLNNDGWPDIYVANDSVPSYFFENQKDGTFVECASRYGISLGRDGDSMAGMGADSADINGDGLLDVIKTNFALETYNIYVAERVGPDEIAYRDFSKRYGIKEAVYHALGWGVLVFDYDNDGDRDIFFANGHVYPEVDARPKLNMSFEQFNQLFRNDSKARPDGSVRLRFKEVTRSTGPGMTIQKSSRGVVWWDFDNDGDQDILVVNLNKTPDLLVNRLGSRKGHWLRVVFVGDPEQKTNRDAIGTRITVVAGKKKQFFETKRGQAFLGSHDPRLHIGLGAHTGPVTLEITWPNGAKATRTIENVDREITIRQTGE
ncbi:MAG: CRTAC1 family protein [Planctomycetota bacterium]|nr:CRTAC1 family protein [Planctomycetota bacterium]